MSSSGWLEKIREKRGQKLKKKYSFLVEEIQSSNIDTQNKIFDNSLQISNLQRIISELHDEISSMNRQLNDSTQRAETKLTSMHMELLKLISELKENQLLSKNQILDTLTQLEKNASESENIICANLNAVNENSKNELIENIGSRFDSIENNSLQRENENAQAIHQANTKIDTMLDYLKKIENKEISNFNEMKLSMDTISKKTGMDKESIEAAITSGVVDVKSNTNKVSNNCRSEIVEKTDDLLNEISELESMLRLTIFNSLVDGINVKEIQ